eukprot:CAMPEP_0202925260 /NCGR_PEP_ID=MMETSP1392-20130828/79404_1 /ASSEMBLY_ACC=CAM_ASM_000868 /TAXON_ID=225041 /ORGANISM="Chlamydomonas chlamydogama, Strain SAG 11-48b" /LENGTH=402 /DNA_ID=CAMNT_0049619029 /DNA_START=76 /DNA_END=1286 /DNA_ORIENTATION=-
MSYRQYDSYPPSDDDSLHEPAIVPTWTFAECAKPEVAAVLPKHYVDVAPWPKSNMLPMVYHKKYNISFLGLEKLHPFDSCKYVKILKQLCSERHLKRSQLVKPKMASHQILLDVHTPEYIRSIHTSSKTVARVTELAPLAALPNCLVQWRVVKPMRYHVCGTMMAAALAMQYGWAINIGGGMHHAYSENGMGWCPFDDIMLACRRLRRASGGAVRKVLYIDLDVHQGGAGQADDGGEAGCEVEMFVVDVYNAGAFPQDTLAKQAIDVDVPMRFNTSTDLYLQCLRAALQRAQRMFPQPDLLVYNAGTDILDGDPLGGFCVSKEGIMQRDLMVWTLALQLKVPIVMVLSGGYAKGNAAVVAASLSNLFTTFKLSAAPDHDTEGGTAKGLQRRVEDREEWAGEA